jgi:hypothetical protein
MHVEEGWLEACSSHHGVGGSGRHRVGERGVMATTTEKKRCAMEELVVAMLNEDNIALFYSLGNSICGPVAGLASTFDVGWMPDKNHYFLRVTGETNPT